MISIPLSQPVKSSQSRRRTNAAFISFVVIVVVANLTPTFGFTAIIPTKQMRTQQFNTQQPLSTPTYLQFKPTYSCSRTSSSLDQEKSSVNGEIDASPSIAKQSSSSAFSNSTDVVNPTSIASVAVASKPFVKKKLQTYLRYLEVECWKRSDLRGLETVLQAVASACKQITRIVQRAQTDDVYGVALDVHGNPLSDTNIQGEVQQKLDVLCNTIMLQAFCGSGRDIHAVASEEEDEPRCCSDVMVRYFGYYGSFFTCSLVTILVLLTTIVVPLIFAKNDSAFAMGDFVAVFDPIDGSKNIDASLPVGTIFGIYKRPPGNDVSIESFLQDGHNLVSAGYCLYSYVLCFY